MSTTGATKRPMASAYIPPAKLRQMQNEIADKSSVEYQRLAWQALKKSIHGLINKANRSNLERVARQLFHENLIRGRGLFCQSLITSQAISPIFTNVFAALVAVVNCKFPQIGALLLRRLIHAFKNAFRRRQKSRLIVIGQFFAHLANQAVLDEMLLLELFAVLLNQPTNASVEVCVAVLKESGALLQSRSRRTLNSVFNQLMTILNEGELDERTTYMLEVAFQLRRDGFKDYPQVAPELALIDWDRQVTHEMSLMEEEEGGDQDDAKNTSDNVGIQSQLDIFKFDADYQENEAKYAEFRRQILDENEGGGDDDEDDDSDSEDDDDDDEEDEEEEEDDENAKSKQPGGGSGVVGGGGGDNAELQGGPEGMKIIDQTNKNLVELQKTVYLKIMSSLSFEDAAHHLLGLRLRPGQEYDVANTIMDCCVQLRSYEDKYGKLAQRMCIAKRPAPPQQEQNGATGQPQTQPQQPGNTMSYVEAYEKIFVEQYEVLHRLENAKLRVLGHFFAHLFFTDSIHWGVLCVVKMNERDSTSSGRIFLKHMFLEMSSHLGIDELVRRFEDPTMAVFYQELFPRGDPSDTRFSINFFTVIGLGPVTVALREFLKSAPPQIASGEQARKSDNRQDEGQQEEEEEQELREKMKNKNAERGVDGDEDEQTEKETAEQRMARKAAKKTQKGEKINKTRKKFQRENETK